MSSSRDVGIRAGRRVGKAVGEALAAVVAAASGGPLVLRTVVNELLRRDPRVRGSVERVRLNPFSGRLTANGVKLAFFRNGDPAGSVMVDEASVRLSWPEAVRGRIVADVSIARPAGLIQIPAGTSRPARRRRPRLRHSDPLGDLAAAIRSLPPIRIGRFSVSDGELHIQNLPGQNGTDVRLEHLDAEITNVVTRDDLSDSGHSEWLLSARAMKTGRLRVNANVDVLAPKPVFNADMQFEGLKLAELSPLVRDATGSDVADGVLSVYAEAAAANGGIRGYAKPVVDHLRLTRPPEAPRLPTLLARLATWAARNSKKDRIATKVTFQGPISHPKIETGGAVRTLVRNAYRQPVLNGLDGGIAASRVAREVEHGEIVLWPRPPSRWTLPFRMIGETMSRWSSNNGGRMGAALSYYTMISIAPVLLLAIVVAGSVFGRDAAEGRVFAELSSMMGATAAATIQSMLQSALKPAAGIIATIASVLTLGFGGSAVMSELKQSLNKIWRTEPPAGLAALVRTRLVGFSIVLSIGFLLLVSLLISAVISAAAAHLDWLLPVSATAVQAINVIISAAVITVLFAILFRFLPDAPVQWKDVWFGALATTLLFIVGRQLLALYLARTAPASAYGAAGSLLIVLIWVYYSAQIFYLGAEFTKVYADRFGSFSSSDFAEGVSDR